MQTDLKWENVKVGDIITVELPYAPYLLGDRHQLTGKVVNIRSIEQTHYDPLELAAISFIDYLIRIKTNEKEYTIPSHVWNLINIERKDKMETQEQKLKEGDAVLVTSKDVKRSLGFPEDEELLAEIVRYDTKINILIHSEQLEKLHLGHDGEMSSRFPNRGCWWVSEHTLQFVKSKEEFDIFM